MKIESEWIDILSLGGTVDLYSIISTLQLNSDGKVDELAAIKAPLPAKNVADSENLIIDATNLTQYQFIISSSPSSTVDDTTPGIYIIEVMNGGDAISTLNNIAITIENIAADPIGSGVTSGIWDLRAKIVTNILYIIFEDYGSSIIGPSISSTITNGDGGALLITLPFGGYDSVPDGLLVSAFLERRIFEWDDGINSDRTQDWYEIAFYPDDKTIERDTIDGSAKIKYNASTFVEDPFDIKSEGIVEDHLSTDIIAQLLPYEPTNILDNSDFTIHQRATTSPFIANLANTPLKNDYIHVADRWVIRPINDINSTEYLEANRLSYTDSDAYNHLPITMKLEKNEIGGSTARILLMQTFKHEYNERLLFGYGSTTTTSTDTPYDIYKSITIGCRLKGISVLPETEVRVIYGVRTTDGSFTTIKYKDISIPDTNEYQIHLNIDQQTDVQDQLSSLHLTAKTVDYEFIGIDLYPKSTTPGIGVSSIIVSDPYVVRGIHDGDNYGLPNKMEKRKPAEELIRCQQFYQRVIDYSIPFSFDYDFSPINKSIINGVVPFKLTMIDLPTITLSNSDLYLNDDDSSTTDSPTSLNGIGTGSISLSLLNVGSYALDPTSERFNIVTTFTDYNPTTLGIGRIDAISKFTWEAECDE